jgi:hypothetical protein
MTMRARAVVVCLALHAGTPFTTVVEAAESRLTGISLLRSGERVSVAVDMTSEPNKIVMRNVAPTILEVEAGPISGRVDSQQLTPSVDVPFVSQVSVREFTAAQQRRFVRLRMTLRNPSRSNVRVVGGTVYVDLAELPRSQRLPSRAAISAAFRSTATPPSRPAADVSYRQTVDASVARLTEIGPFLLSAAGSPSPDVLAVVSQTLTTIHDSLRAADVPSSAAPAHDLLTSAVALAARAVAADFSGDRVAQVRRALALVDDAKALIP